MTLQTSFPAAVCALSRYRSWLIGAAMVAIVIIAAFFRLYRVDTFLHWAFGDEMSYGIEGQRVIQGQYQGLFAYTWDQAPTTYAYLVAACQRLFGANIMAGRILSVSFGVLMVPLIALVGRAMNMSWTSSLLAAALLAVSHWHTHFSRMVLPSVISAFFLLLALYFVLLAYRRGSWLLFAIAGILCGFAPYVFLSNRIIVPVLCVWFMYLVVFHQSWVRSSWPKILLFTTALTVVVLPLAIFWMHNPDEFLGPERHVGIMYNLNAWSSQHPGQPATFLNVLLHQIPLAASMFTVFGGPYPPWGGTYAPAMDFVTGHLLIVALAYALFRLRRPLVAFVFIWFVMIWFFGVVLTLDAPQMEHAVGLIPAAFLLIAVLCEDFVGILFAHRGRYFLYPTFALGLVLVSAVLNFYVFFGVWGQQLQGSGGFAWQYYDAAQYVARQSTPHGTAVYAANYPDEFFRFLAPRAGEFTADPAHVQKASLYIIFPGAPVSPAAIAARIPGNRYEPVRDVDGDLAFTAVIPPRP